MHAYIHTAELIFQLSVAAPMSQLILQPLPRFTYVSIFSNPSVASPTSQLVLQTFFRFSYVAGFSLTSPGEPPMIGSRQAVEKEGHHDFTGTRMDSIKFLWRGIIEVFPLLSLPFALELKMVAPRFVPLWR